MNTRWIVRGALLVGAIQAGACGTKPPPSETGVGGDIFPSGGETGFGGIGGIGGNGVVCGGTGVGGDVAGVGMTATPQFAPDLGTTYSQQVAPPAISGGTLLILADGKTAVAADPDRDTISIVDLPSRTVKSTIALQPGDEPGRLVQDATGRVHVALRHGGALVTCDPASGTIVSRRAVCAAPRGLAYDPTSDVIHVACHDGQLVSLPAGGGDPVRRLQLDDDLRDVIVDNGKLLVTRFRTAEVLTVGADGTVAGRVQPPAFSSASAHGGNLFTPSIAWRALPAPGGGVVVLHQRGMVDPVIPTAGGYGGPGPCDAIVHSCITRVDRDGTTESGPALATLVLAVDMAISPDGNQVAVVAAGNATNTDQFANAQTPALTRVFLTDLHSATDPQVGCSPDGMHGPCLPPDFSGGIVVGGFAGSPGTGGVAIEGSTSTTGAGGVAGGPIVMGAGGSRASSTGAGGATGAAGAGGVAIPATGEGGATGAGGQGVCPSATPGVPFVVGQPVAVAFDPSGGLVVQSREPAMLSLGDGTTISLSTVSRIDTGHTLFHANAGGFLACASCHAEGNEDGRVWNFACIGPRRTQSVQTGLSGTEPFHWDGDETDFPHLMTDVFQGRMSGPVLGSDQGSALLSWLDKQPRPPKPAPADTAAVGRGQALFKDPSHGCAICHAGAHMTNNQTVDVGTGSRLQVPSLIGVGSRAPYLHDGCAATLADRFGTCGGGDQHGVTSNLSAGDVSDLVAYLKTL